MSIDCLIVFVTLLENLLEFTLADCFDISKEIFK